MIFRCLICTMMMLMSCICPADEAVAQALPCQSFKMLDEHSGLSDHHVQCICQDSNRFMWIGTASGLNRVDGSSITVFQSDPNNAQTLSDNDIHAMVCDRNGVLWVGTASGLNRLDPMLGVATHIALIKGPNQPEIRSLALSPAGLITVGTNLGLFCYDPSSRHSYPIPLPIIGDKRAIRNDITQIIYDASGRLWIATYHGLEWYDAENGSCGIALGRSGSPVYNDLITSLIISHSGKLWMGTWADGVLEYDPSTRELTRLHLPQPWTNVLSIAEVCSPPDDYSIWINGNALRFDEQTRSFNEQKDVPFLEPDNSATTLCVTHDHWVWAGTGKALYYSGPSQNCIHILKSVRPTTSQGNAILPWKHQFLVSGSNRYFLRAFDENLHQTDNFYSAALPKEISCISLQAAGADRVLCGTTQGVAVLNLARHQFHIHQISDKLHPSATLNFITSMQRDSNKGWWLFPWRNGIWHADSSLAHIRLFQMAMGAAAGPSQPMIIADACEDTNGNLWFADLDEGIIFYDRRRKQFSKPFSKAINGHGTIQQILCRGNECFSFSGTALLRWDVNHRRLHKIELSPVVEKQISSMAFDAQGRLWIATHQGLFAYTIPDSSLTRFTTADGLPADELDGTLCAHPDGYMVFASSYLLFTFRPQQMFASVHRQPSVRLVAMFVNGVAHSVHADQPLSFDHNAHDFTFRWAVTDYNNPLDNRYFYKLDGIDSAWRQAGKSGTVDFRNLAPGTYVLWLSGANANNVTASKPLEIRFRIRPPIWATKWFGALIFVLVAAIFYGLYRLRLRQFVKIEQLRSKISRDLHDDIGSTLSSISIMSEMGLTRSHDSSEGTQEILNDINEQSRNLMDKMDDIVWSINPKNDELISLFSRLQAVSSRLFEAKGVQYRFEVDEHLHQLRLPMEFRQHIFLIVKEAVNNMAKHAGCTTASIIATYHAPRLQIDLRDNGRGFDERETLRGNGIESMRKRAEAMKARFTIDSVPGQGTHICLIVKIT